MKLSRPAAVVRVGPRGTPWPIPPHFRQSPSTAHPACRRSSSIPTTSSSRTTKASSATAPARARSATSSRTGASRCARRATIRSARSRATRFPRRPSTTLLAKGDAEAAGIVQGAIEDFSQELALVIRRYLKTKGWKDTERIVVGGGFRASRVGELVIGRTSVILKADKVPIELVPIRNDPDEAGLIGAVHLAPKWLFKAPRRDPRGRHRRHQHPRRRGRAQPEEGAGPVEGQRLEVRAVASRRREEGRPRRRHQEAGRHARRP